MSSTIDLVIITLICLKVEKLPSKRRIGCWGHRTRRYSAESDSPMTLTFFFPHQFLNKVYLADNKQDTRAVPPFPAPLLFFVSRRRFVNLRLTLRRDLHRE